MTTAIAEPQLRPGEQTRTFAADLEIVTRAKGGDGMTIRGIAVPWDQWIDVYGDGWLYESFRSGVADHQFNAFNRIKLANRHMYRGGELIGVTTLLRNDAKGLYWEARRANVPAGEIAFELAANGALDQLSVGFRERTGGNEYKIDETTGLELKNWIIRTKVDLFEVAMVPEGAYGDGATIEGIRDRAQRGTPLDKTDQARAALRLLGYPEADVERAVRTLQGETPDDNVAARILASLPEL